MSFRIAIVGDFLTDVYWIGTTNRLSAEVPVPIVKITKIKEFPGGAGNVAANLAALGVHCDWFGEQGPKKNRLVVDGHQLARWDQDDECRPAMGLDRLKDVDAIVVSDYGKGSVDNFTIEYIKRYLRDVVAIPLFVDTKQDPSPWSGVATAIFPNRKEFDQYKDAYAEFKGIVVIKQGKDGLHLCPWKDYGSWDHLISPSQARFVKSPNGAGDSVLASFVYKYLVDKNSKLASDPSAWGEILDFANAAAAVACEHEYTYAPTLREVEARFYES